MSSRFVLTQAIRVAMARVLLGELKPNELPKAIKGTHFFAYDREGVLRDMISISDGCHFPRQVMAVFHRGKCCGFLGVGFSTIIYLPMGSSYSVRLLGKPRHYRGPDKKKH